MDEGRSKFTKEKDNQKDEKDLENEKDQTTKKGKARKQTKNIIHGENEKTKQQLHKLVG